jgi:hypothetical protein
MKRFAVAIDNPSVEENIAFNAYIEKHQLGWWHWVGTFWLIVDGSSSLTSILLLEDLRAIYPNKDLIVIELNQGAVSWAAFGPNGPNRDMFPWLHQYLDS